VFCRDFIAFLVVKIEGGSGSHDLGCFWWVWWANIAKKEPVRTDYCDQARNSSAANEFEGAYQFIEHGFFDYVGNGISAHMELDTLVSLTSSFMGNVAVVPLLGFQASISFSVLYSSFNVTS
jgi:hypothetical protein